MPRRARHYISGLPYHLVQRGNNRAACFYEPADYACYLALWQELSARYGVSVHAYCLMTNHIHFLATPERSDSLSNLMKVAGSRYAQHINRKYKRTGTLWEGRHRSSLVQSETYLLSCYRYIELNPVRARMVTHPGDYPWSSYGANVTGASHWLVAHPEYLRLGPGVCERARAYEALFDQHLHEDDVSMIRKGLHFNHPTADERFCNAIEKEYGIDLGRMARGRPPKLEHGGSG